jgi:hypothetical protein
MFLGTESGLTDAETRSLADAAVTAFLGAYGRVP